MHRRAYNPYRRVSKGIIIPPFTTLTSWEDEPTPGQLEFVGTVGHRYPIVFCDLESTPFILLPRVGFIPQTVGLRVLKPILLCSRLAVDYNSNSVTVGYHALIGLEELGKCSGYTIASRRIALAEIGYVREYRSKHHRVPYIAVPRPRVRSRLSPESLRFIHKLEPGTRVRYRGLIVEVDAQAESLEEALDAVGRSVALVSTHMEARITTVILYARNGLFVNASQPTPLSPQGRYTVARIGCREWPSALLLVVDWDDDLFSVQESMFSLFDVLAFRWVKLYGSV